MGKKYLLGATESNEIVFGEFGVTTRNGYPEFTASFDTVDPFTGDDVDAEAYYEDYIDQIDDGEKYRLCEGYNCRPSELAAVMTEREGQDPMEIRDCSLFPAIIDVDGVEYFFESGCCGQHDTRNEMKEYTDQKAYNELHKLWDTFHLRRVDSNVSKAVEKLQERLSGIDVDEWIESYIRREVA